MYPMVRFPTSTTRTQACCCLNVAWHAQVQRALQRALQHAMHTHVALASDGPPGYFWHTLHYVSLRPPARRPDDALLFHLVPKLSILAIPDISSLIISKYSQLCNFPIYPVLFSSPVNSQVSFFPYGQACYFPGFIPKRWIVSIDCKAFIR